MAHTAGFGDPSRTALLVASLLGALAGQAQGGKCFQWDCGDLRDSEGCCPAPPAKAKKDAQVSIDSAPQGASVSVDGAQVGVTPWRGSVSKATHAVVIALTGYKTVETSMKVGSSAASRTLFAALQAVVVKTQLQVTPGEAWFAGAEVAVDGQVVGAVPLTLELSPGRHQLVVRKAKYDELSQWVELAAGKTLVVAVKLVMSKVVVPTGNVMVSASLEGAEIYVDGTQHSERTPALLSGLTVGEHAVEIRKPPAPPWKGTVTVTAGATVKVHAELRVPVVVAQNPLLADCRAKQAAACKALRADLVKGAAALARESDLEHARATLKMHLEALEVLLASQPRDRALLEQAAELSWQLGYGFFEDDLEAANSDDDKARAAAIKMYERCSKRGLALLALSNAGWNSALDPGTSDATFAALLAKAGKADVAGLYFAGLGLWAHINLDRGNIELVTLLPRAERLVSRVLELAPQFRDGGPAITLGVFHASRSAAIGGNPERGAKLFDAAIAASKGKLLLPSLLKARVYAVTIGDEALFTRLLEAIVAASPELWPERRLDNEIAKRRARRYLQARKQWF